MGFGAPVRGSVIPLVSALLCLVTMAPKAHAQIPAGTEFRIGASGNGHFSDVTMDDVGNFMVVWHEVSPTDLIRARRYDAAGAPLGSALTVNLPGQTGFPAIASESVTRR